MRAWVINNRKLVLQQRDIAAPGPEDVQVQVRAIGINRADLLQVKGYYPAPPGTDADIPGLEYAGIISAIGQRVRHRQVGERVMGLVPGAAYAEQLLCHERETLRIPSGLDFAAAATLPEAFLTAYRALFLEAGLQPGQWCLIRPASAAVGLAATQLASALGARPLGSSRQPERLDNAVAMGLLHRIDEQQLLEQVLAHTDGEGVAVILDMLGPDWTTLQQVLAVQGCLLSLGIMAGKETGVDIWQMLKKRQRLQALTMRSQPLEQRLRLARYFNQRLLPLFNQQRLLPLPLQSFDFSLAPQAHQHLREISFSGKRVLVV